MAQCLGELSSQGTLSKACTPEWTAEFFFRHFRGTVVDWILRRGSYPLWPKLEQDYAFFASAFHA